MKEDILPNDIYREQFDDIEFEPSDTLAAYSEKLVARGANIALDQIDDPEDSTWFDFTPTGARVCKCPFFGKIVVKMELPYSQILEQFKDTVKGEENLKYLQEIASAVEKLAKGIRAAVTKREKKGK